MMRKLITLFLLNLAVCSIAQQKEIQLTLQEAIDYSLVHNHNIRNANLDVQIAQQKVRETISQGLPQISGNVDYDYFINQPVSILPDFISPAVIGINQQLGLLSPQQANQAIQNLPGKPQEVVFGTKHKFMAGARWEQLLFSGSYLVGLQSAKAFKEISILGKEKTESEIRKAVINAYTGVLAAQENVKIIQKNLKVSERNLYEIEEIYKVGLTEEQSVEQLRYMNKRLSNALRFAESQKEIAENTLKYILGIDQENTLTLTSDLDYLMSSDLLVPSILNQENIENHVDYRLAINKVKTNELQVKYEKSKALPTLSAFLSHYYNEAGNEFLFTADEKSTSNTTLVGVRLTVPIFSSFARASRTQQATLEYEKSLVDIDKTKQELLHKAEQARLEYETAQDNYKTAQDLVNLSQSIYDKEKVKFTEGISSSRDLATAEQQLYDSQNQFIQSILQVVSAKNNLNQALGNN